MKKTIFIIILLFSFLIFIFSMFNIINWYLNTKKELSELVEISNQKNILDNENTNFYYSDDIYKNINFLEIDFTSLKEINSSTVGWIKVEGTQVNYPFVQTIDNSFYLTHSFNKEYNPAGWVFLDYRNNINLEDKNTIIYAHAQKNKTMFGSLKDTLKNEWFADKNNHFVRISTQDQNSVWQIFSIYTINTTTDYLKIDFSNDFSDFTNTLISRSIYAFDTNINKNDRILTLSTCHGKNTKIVLHAKLVKTQSR